MARPDKNRQRRREALREELQARAYLKNLDEVEQTVRENWHDMTSTQVQALRLRVDVNIAKLRKCLPDLKAVEHSGPGGNEIPVGFRVEFVDP